VFLDRYQATPSKSKLLTMASFELYVAESTSLTYNVSGAVAGMRVQ